MTTAEEFHNEMKEFIFRQKLDSYHDSYWKSVALGVVILFKYRDIFNSKAELISNYLSVKKEILDAYNNDILLDDFTDELNAVLINYYNHTMPDFWSCSFREYINSGYLKRYLEMLE
jgi:hypothetical protein